jgi:hypothetical protein
MTSEGLGEMFEGNSADMCAGKFLLVSMGVTSGLSSVRRRGARTPIGASGNSFLLLLVLLPPLFKTSERVVLGFQIFAWAPKKIIKVLGKRRKKSDPHPWPPGGDF